MYERILIALQGNGSDEAVLNHVQELAVQMNARVTALRVIAVADDGGEGLGKQIQLEIGSSGWRRKNEAEEHLSRVACRLQQSGLDVETALRVTTRPEAEEIITCAAESGFDLIAMASDSRPWYKRLFRNAQDDDVMRKATVPTLFIGDHSRRVPVTPITPRANRLMAVLGNAEL